MIEAKYIYENESKWNYKNFNSESEAIEYFEGDEKQITDYKFRTKPNNPFKNWWHNIRNTKKNYKKVRASPYASLTLSLKLRQLIIGLLIPFIAWRILVMVKNFSGTGFMGIFTQLFMVGIGAYMCWKLYSTIPMAKKQIEYYKKYPHTINYCPTDTKQTIEEIMGNIKNNQKGVKNGSRNKQKKQSSNSKTG